MHAVIILWWYQVAFAHIIRTRLYIILSSSQLISDGSAEIFIPPYVQSMTITERGKARKVGLTTAPLLERPTMDQETLTKLITEHLQTRDIFETMKNIRSKCWLALFAELMCDLTRHLIFLQDVSDLLFDSLQATYKCSWCGIALLTHYRIFPHHLHRPIQRMNLWAGSQSLNRLKLSHFSYCTFR